MPSRRLQQRSGLPDSNASGVGYSTAGTDGRGSSNYGGTPGVQGNIDTSTRPPWRMPDGSVATVYSMSFDDDGYEVLVPTITADGQLLSDDQARQRYYDTGEHLGKFRSVPSAEQGAVALHDAEESRVNGWPRPAQDARPVSSGLRRQPASTNVFDEWSKRIHPRR